MRLLQDFVLRNDNLNLSPHNDKEEVLSLAMTDHKVFFDFVKLYF